MLKIFFSILFFVSLLSQDYYHIRLLQGESGHQESLKSQIKSDIKSYAKQSKYSPVLLQHKQGAFWDFMLIIPIPNNQIPNYENFKTFNYHYFSEINSSMIYQSDYIFSGPKHDEFFKESLTHSFFHIEMFVPIPGKEKALYEERDMETAYLKEVGYNGNYTFLKTFGGEYSIMTIGLYENFREFASQEGIPLDKDNAAAKKAGFKSVGDIGNYLRTLLRKHSDTLTKKVN